MPDEIIEENLSQEEPAEEEFIDETNNESIRNFLGDDAVETIAPEESKERAPQEEPVQETPPAKATPSSEPEPEVDLKEIAEEIKRTTREELKQEVLKSIGITEEQKQKAGDEGFKFPWELRGETSPATWHEQAEGNRQYLEFVRKQEEAKAAEVNKKTQEAELIRVQDINNRWDEQLEYLRSEGSLPAIAPEIKTKLKEGKRLTAEERKDPGLVAQRDMFDLMSQLATEAEERGEKPIGDIVHIYNRFYVKKNKKPAGAAAPVSGSRPAVSTQKGELSYEELHNSDMSELINIV